MNRQNMKRYLKKCGENKHKEWEKENKEISNN